jgi:tetratricopeptide (TPR) repeat protein
LREGSEEPEVSWQAAMNATFLNQHESVLTYLDKFTEVVPDQQWTHYYRALSNLQLGRFEAAIAAAQSEKEEHEYESTLHLEIIIAASRFALGQTEEALQHLQELNQVGFSSITDMTPTGIQKLTSLLYEHAKELPINHREREEFTRLLLETNMVPDDYFDRPEEADLDNDGESATVRRFLYRCILRQHLAADWSTSRGCFAHQKEWDHYLCEWGVISETPERAAELALEVQGRFVPDAELEVLDVTELDGPYTDNAGVVFQGDRWNETEQDEAQENWDPDAQDNETA